MMKPNPIRSQLLVVVALVGLALGGAGCQSPAGSGNSASASASAGDSNSTLSSYYRSVTGLTGADLKAALHKVISTGVTHLSYSDVWTALEKADEDPNNPQNVIEIYTGWSIPKVAKAQNNQANYWNREHVWAKSHGDFGTNPGPGTDLHHLRPADASINSTRNNNDFDEGGTTVVDNSPYGTYGATTGNKIDGSLSWEPRDEDKGDVARMMFYMAVMYDGKDLTYDPVNLELNEAVGNESLAAIGKLSTLKKWNTIDPVDAAERRRNDAVESIQGNRNPFIDHPEWVNAIW